MRADELRGSVRIVDKLMLNGVGRAYKLIQCNGSGGRAYKLMQCGGSMGMVYNMIQCSGTGKGGCMG